MTAVTGTLAEAVGPYTSATTEALDLGLVVPIAVIAAVQLLTRRPMGRVLALMMLVVNVCADGPRRRSTRVGRTAHRPRNRHHDVTFAALTLIASGLLARMVQAGARNAP
jgi:hypothetical protein